MTTSIEKVPVEALCYLVNGDTEGLTDEEIKEIDDLLERQNVQSVFPVSNDEHLQSYWGTNPWFGPYLNEVVDCEVTYRD